MTMRAETKPYAEAIRSKVFTTARLALMSDMEVVHESDILSTRLSKMVYGNRGQVSRKTIVRNLELLNKEAGRRGPERMKAAKDTYAARSREIKARKMRNRIRNLCPEL